MPRLSKTPALTPQRIEALKPRENRYEVADSGAPGLRLRVMPSGLRVFRWYCTSAGKVVTIGPWAKTPAPGCVTLDEARTTLTRLKLAHKEGRLATEEEALARSLRPSRTPEPADPSALTVQSVAADFLAYLDKKRRRPEQARRIFNVEVLPRIGDRPIASITKRDIRVLIEGVVARGSPVMAGQVRAVLKQFFEWAVDREENLAMPGFPKLDTLGGRKATPSQRFLSAGEIKAFWHALDSYKGVTPTVRNALKLALLTGVRSGELLGATWDEVDTDAATWTIPVARQKLTKAREAVARPFVVPLAPLAVRLFKELRALADVIPSPNVLASFHPAAKGEPITEKALNHAMRRMATGEEPVLKLAGERPTPHDLRRTLRTHLAETLRVPPHVAESCLNHSPGTIAATYHVGDHLAERRQALTKWAAYVEKLVGAGPTRATGTKS